MAVTCCRQGSIPGHSAWSWCPWACHGTVRVGMVVWGPLGGPWACLGLVAASGLCGLGFREMPGVGGGLGFGRARAQGAPGHPLNTHPCRGPLQVHPVSCWGGDKCPGHGCPSHWNHWPPAPPTLRACQLFPAACEAQAGPGSGLCSSFTHGSACGVSRAFLSADLMRSPIPQPVGSAQVLG